MTAALATRPQNGHAAGTSLAARIAPDEFTREYLDVLKSTYARKTSDIEFALAVQVSKATGLRIDTHELWVYKRNDNDPATITIGIDGFRAIAHSSGVYNGEEGPLFCGPDGRYVDTWLEKAPPAAAKFSVYRKDAPRPFTAVVLYSEFKGIGPLWDKKPVHMLGIRAATHAFRKAFRQEIAATQTQAQALGVALDADPEAVEADQGEQVSQDTKLVRRWNELTKEALALGVEYDDVRPADVSKATDEELVAAGRIVRARVDAAKAATAPVPIEAPAKRITEFGAALEAGEVVMPDVSLDDEEATDVELRLDDEAPAAQPEGEAPEETQGDAAPSAMSRTMLALWDEYEEVSRKALDRGIGHTAPPKDATSAVLLGAITALEDKLKAADEAGATKAKRR